VNIQAVGGPGAGWEAAPALAGATTRAGEGAVGTAGIAEGAVPVGEGAPGVVGAGERVQRLQTLISQVERGAGGFAAALQAAQSTGTADTATSSAATDPGLAGGATIDAADTIPTAAGTIPTAAGTIPTEAGTIPTAADTIPAGADTIPAGADTIPTAAGTIPAGTGAIAAADVTAAATAPTGSGAAYAGLIQEAAIRNGVEPALLHGLIEQESGFDPSATSSAGAVGLTQLMPSTAASLGVTEPLDPVQSIEGGARLLGELMRQFGGNTGDALAAYNAGAGAVEQYGGIPPYPETEQYVTKVLANAEAYRQSVGATAGGAPAPVGEVDSTAGGTRA